MQDSQKKTNTTGVGLHHLKTGGNDWPVFIQSDHGEDGSVVLTLTFQPGGRPTRPIEGHDQGRLLVLVSDISNLMEVPEKPCANQGVTLLEATIDFTRRLDHRKTRHIEEHPDSEDHGSGGTGGGGGESATRDKEELAVTR